MYEIAQSHNLGKGLLGIRLNNIADWSGDTELPGVNPFGHVTLDRGLFGNDAIASFYPVYDWILDDGYNNAATWIEEAATAAGHRERLPVDAVPVGHGRQVIAG